MVLYASFPLIDNHHDHMMEQLNFEPQGRGGGGGFCEINICYHVAAFVIPFNWYATWLYPEKV